MVRRRRASSGKENRRSVLRRSLLSVFPITVLLLATGHALTPCVPSKNGTGSKSSSSSSNIQFRVHLPHDSRLQALMIQQLQLQLGNNYSQIQITEQTRSGYFDVSLDRGTSLEKWFWHHLPACKVSLILPKVAWTTTSSGTSNNRDTETQIAVDSLASYCWIDEMEFRERLQAIIALWSDLDDGAISNYSFSLQSLPRASNRSRKRRNETTKVSELTARHIQQELSDRLAQFFLEAATGVSHLSAKTEGNDKIVCGISRSDERNGIIQWDVEVPFLIRIYPLSKLHSKRKRHINTKRLESFVVARLANVQPSDIVLDPCCKRGALLIEAAKYWPLAGAYLGVDSNMGHLEHASMNADSTMTCLKLFHRSSRASADKIPTLISPKSVDKLMTCLPFGQSFTTYQRIMQAWRRLLKDDTGSMILVIDQPSLDSCLAAIANTMPEYGITTFPNAIMSWGGDKACLIRVDLLTLVESSSNKLKQQLNDTDRIEIVQTKNSWTAYWGEHRSKTVPALISATQQQQRRQWNNKLIFS